LLGGSSLKGQSMIDLSKEEVRVMVKDKHMEFRRDKSVVNQRFNYLKYVNGLRTRTWILYFTDEDICRSTKMICDYGEYDEVLEELNEAHEKVDLSAGGRFYSCGPDQTGVVFYSERSKKEVSGNKRSP